MLEKACSSHFHVHDILSNDTSSDRHAVTSVGLSSHNCMETCIWDLYAIPQYRTNKRPFIGRTLVRCVSVTAFREMPEPLIPQLVSSPLS